MMKRSEEMYVSNGPLRDISHRQLQGLGRIEAARSGIEFDLNFYIQENKQLKIKCSKIDQIQKCANILMENAEKYKKKSREFENKVMQLTRDNDILRVQAQKVANIKFLKEENLRKQGEISGLRKKMEMNDNFHLIRLEQQLANQKQARERIVSNAQAKHKAELSKVEHQLKLSLNKMEHDNQMLKERTDSLVKQIAHLKTSNAQVDSEVRTMVMENNHLQNELIKAQDLLVQTQNQINLLNQNYCQLKARSEQALNTLTLQVHRLDTQLDKSLSKQSMLQRMNEQLKNQGGVLILQNEQLKARTLQLEQLHLIDLATIKGMQQQLNALMDSIHNIEAKMVDRDIASRQTMDTVERDNIVLRKTIKDFQIEMATKQKEIQDLIIIVAKLQTQIKLISSTAAANLQTNSTLLSQLNEDQANIAVLSQEIQSYKKRIKELEEDLLEREAQIHNLIKDKSNVEQVLNRERQAVIDMERILQIGKNHLGDEKATIAKLQKELKQKQAIIQRLHSDKEQFSKISSKQRQQNVDYQQRIEELQRLVMQLKDKLAQSEKQMKNVRQECQQQKDKTIKEGMEQMQRLISAKYDQILKQYQQYYDAKIKTLQDQIRQFTAQLEQANF